MVFVPKCTVFSKAVQILWSSYVYFEKAVQPLKSCTNKEKSCTSLVNYVLALNFIDNGIIKMYSFFQSCTNSVVLICIILKSCTTKEKSCTSLVHCNFIDNGVCTNMLIFFPNLYKFFGPHMYIFKKLYKQRKKLYIFGTLCVGS